MMDKMRRDKMRKHLTKGEMRDIMSKIKSKRRKECVVMFALVAILTTTLMLVTSCGVGKTVSMGGGQYQEVEERTKNFLPSEFVSQIWWDEGDIDFINQQLEGTGVTAFVVDKNNLEHQRRYRRHLSGNLNPPPLSGWDKHRRHFSKKINPTGCQYCVTYWTIIP